MKLRKLMAGTLAATMVLGSSMMVFAEDENTGSATGTGSSVGHVDKEVLKVTLPTGTDNTFDYWVDPERVINEAGSLASGTTVQKNEDGVYFKNGGASGTTYSNSSDAVEFVGKNSVAVDVSVVATVEATGEKDIALVADDTALAAATTPALLMNLTVGTDTKAITSEGATVKEKLDGVPSNFKISAENGVYKYAPKTDADEDLWKKTTVKLTGKTNNKEVATDMTAPKIKLTWTIEKHVDSYLSGTSLNSTTTSLTMNLPESVSVSKVELVTGATRVALALGNTYTIQGNTLGIKSSVITNNKNSEIVVTYSDGHTDTLDIQ